MNETKYAFEKAVEIFSHFFTEFIVRGSFNASSKNFEIVFSSSNLSYWANFTYVINLDLNKLINEMDEIAKDEQKPNVPDFFSNIDSYAEEIGKRFDEFKNYLIQFNGVKDNYDNIARFFIRKGLGPVRGKIFGI